MEMGGVKVTDARVERYAELLLDTCLGVQRGWLTQAPLEVISDPASIEVYALEHCDALLSIAAPENTDDGAAAAGVGLGAEIGAGRTSAVRRAYRPPGARLPPDE